MNRRASLQSLGAIASHALFPSILSAFVASCNSGHTPASNTQLFFFTEDEIAFVQEVIDLILPATATRSASQVLTHHFLDEVFAKCLTPTQQAMLKEGVSGLRTQLAKSTNKEATLAEVDRHALCGSRYSVESSFLYSC